MIDIDEGTVGDFPQLDGYDEKMATACQALGIEPESWQVGGRTFEGVPFWALLTAEDLCWAFVDRIEGKRSHLIFARYPEPTDAWALEAIRAAQGQGFEVQLRAWALEQWWSVQVWNPPPDAATGRRGIIVGSDDGPDLGPAVAIALLQALRPSRAPWRDKTPRGRLGQGSRENVE